MIRNKTLSRIAKKISSITQKIYKKNKKIMRPNKCQPKNKWRKSKSKKMMHEVKSIFIK